MVLKLYGSSRSPATRLVALIAKEKNISFEFVGIDFPSREHKSAAYLEKQPFGQVPYIVSNPVICWYVGGYRSTR